MMETKPAPRLASATIFVAGSALIVWLFMTGAAIERAISGEAGREAIIAAIWSHVGWGVVAAPLLIAYGGWRLSCFAPHKDGLGRLQLYLLWALAALIAFLIVSGPIVVWTHGSALKVFGWFAIASPTGKLPAIHDPLEIAHLWAGRAAPWLVAAEAGVFGAGLVRQRS
jgi:cytochrome b561